MCEIVMYQKMQFCCVQPQSTNVSLVFTFLCLPTYCLSSLINDLYNKNFSFSKHALLPKTFLNYSFMHVIMVRMCFLTQALSKKRLATFMKPFDVPFVRHINDILRFAVGFCHTYGHFEQLRQLSLYLFINLSFIAPKIHEVLFVV